MAERDRIAEFKEVVELMPDDPVVRFGLAGARLPQRQRQPARGAPGAWRGTRVQANVAGCLRYWSSVA